MQTRLTFALIALTSLTALTFSTAKAEPVRILIAMAEPMLGFTTMQECADSPFSIGQCQKLIPASKCEGRTVYTSDLTAQTFIRAFKSDRFISVTSMPNSRKEAKILCEFNNF